MDFEGLVWRHVPRGAHPLHVGYILLAAGRWNRHDDYGCLYTSLSREGALAEYAKELARLGIESSADHPKDVVSLNVGIARVLDLTDERERRRFGINLATLTGDSDEDLESCRIVADLARLQGYDAILSPSAALGAARNLNLYMDERADHLRLMERPDRARLNYQHYSDSDRSMSVRWHAGKATAVLPRKQIQRIDPDQHDAPVHAGPRCLPAAVGQQEIAKWQQRDGECGEPFAAWTTPERGD